MQELSNVLAGKYEEVVEKISSFSNEHLNDGYKSICIDATKALFSNNEEQVKKELVFADTLFVNKDYTLMWLKNTSGSIKTYELNEVIELDEKDRKIADLEAKLDKLVKEKENEQYVNEDANGTTSSKKSTNGKSNKTSNE